MSSDFKKFKTVENLAKAFVGESMARNRYTFYASTAKKEGFEQISEIFAITAENEREHASWFYKMLMEIRDKHGIDLKDLKIETHVPVLRAKTIENLKGAIIGETEEYSMLYPEFARVAEEEGFKEIAARIKAIAIAEKHHAQRYEKLKKELEQESLFKKENEVWWVCRECGYVHYGREPPEKCPSCGHERGFYQLMCENY